MFIARHASLAAGLLLASGSFSPVDAAVWGNLVSLGTEALFSDPVCAADAVGAAVCVAAVQGGGLAANRYAVGKWSGWKLLAGTVDGKASCAKIAAGRVLCGIRDGEDVLVAYSFNAGTWTGPVTVGGVLASDPSCAALAADRAICVGVSAASNYGTSDIFSADYDGLGWKLPPAQTTVAFSPVNCAPDDRGHAICVWTGAGHHIMAKQYNGAEWLATLDLGGRASGPPACLDSGLRSGAVVCYGIGTDQSAYYNIFNGKLWSLQSWGSQWLNFGGVLTNLSCAQDGSRDAVLSTVCAATGVAPPSGDKYGQLWVWGASAVGGADSWTPLGGQVIGAPACVVLDATVSPGKVMCVAQTLANTAVSVIGP